MNIQELDIPGCYLIELPHFKDERGEFVKTFNNTVLKGTPLGDFDLQEEFYSVSRRNVLRGLHFQAPPAAHNKLVYCIQGEVLDFFLDIRKDSPTYGKYFSLRLTSEKPELLFLPKGLAHGFLTVSESAILVYKTDHVYVPESDTGIHWSSIGLDIAQKELIISDRDKSFPTLEDYKSQFK
ncbi:dTDP-4-dehydrorhamnose 3,5-epimerase [Vibrio diazotrophicus]|uniref:dTDP-4-dehydrorhamnose 3,5-epimerase n=1 Tax=Vibrio diazotrophicus TaxID=685 RepID=UPI000C9DD1D7|nr:dTDP-4-dehydrorhamnose 3,5-epimerase [Vibrio diazotrophicus]PNH80586.1 dTDP-4-dehydrorhamnose 3,5-epimerase [Vibrio diazotrophicus]